ncbi:hypothetical protein ACKVMT_13930 [Halobacteriales archaeon Cl-PHB]
MPDWNRISRETGKSLITGTVGGVMAISVNNDAAMEGFITAFLFFVLVAIAIAAFEYLFPREEDGNEGKEEGNTPRIAS